MAADLAQAVGALVDEIADLEIDEDLLHPASGSVGDSEEEEAVQAAAPAPAPAAAANRGRGTSAKGADSGKRRAPAMHRVGSPGTCLTLARPFGRPMNFHPECWNKWHFECAACL